MRTLAIFAALAGVAVTVGALQAFRVYRELDDGFDDIITHEYGTNPATWPRAVRDPK